MSSRRPTDSPHGADSSGAKKPPPPRRPRPSPRVEDKDEGVMVESPTPVLMSRRIEISADARRAMIAEAAYLRAERRGFEHGHEVEDWLSAEVEVNALLQHGQRTTAQ